MKIIFEPEERELIYFNNVPPSNFTVLKYENNIYLLNCERPYKWEDILTGGKIWLHNKSFPSIKEALSFARLIRNTPIYTFEHLYQVKEWIKENII